MILVRGKTIERRFIIVDSILTTIKEMLGITEEYTHFDIDIIAHINTALSILSQIGVTKTKGFSIRDSWATWDSIINPGTDLEMIKTYIFMKVKLIFDPPQSSGAVESMKQLISEFEWRISVSVDPPSTFNSTQQGGLL